MDKRVAYFQEMLGAFLKGKVAILNGAGNSIGVAIAKALVEAGATVYIACNKVDGDIQALSAIYEDRIKLSLCNCVEKNDMSKFVERVMRECSKIDILVNNPSFNAPAKLEELEDHVFYKMMDECLIGAYHACPECCSSYEGTAIWKDCKCKPFRCEAWRGLAWPAFQYCAWRPS